MYRIVLTDSYLYIKKPIKVYMMILFGFQTVKKLQSQSIKKDVFPLWSLLINDKLYELCMAKLNYYTLHKDLQEYNVSAWPVCWSISLTAFFFGSAILVNFGSIILLGIYHF